jgi:CheY-like chemotaxis protein
MLVVDDEPRVLDVVRDHFGERYDIATAISASGAVELFQQQRPDVVFLDINMPGVDGLTLLTFLRRVEPQVPIIIVTGNTQTSLAARALKAGAFGYVPKPFNLMYMEHLAAAAIGLP